MSEPKSVAVYMRVSTHTQTIDLQRDDLERYVNARGWAVYKEYVDLCVSGSKESRQALNELMEDARKLRFDAVAVWRFDRFARSTKHLINALTEFNELGIGFVSFSENIDLSTAMGKAMFTVISAMAELERNLIRERVNAGLSAAKRRGSKLGRPRKRNDCEIMALREKGFSLRKISSTLKISKGAIERCLATVPKTQQIQSQFIQ